MDITTLIKTTTVIHTGCSIAIVAIAAYSAKQSARLNKTIAEGTAEIARGNKMMNEFISTIK